MHKQHRARSLCCIGRDTPVSGNAIRNMARTANLGLRIIDVPNRSIRQIKVPIRCILCPFRPLCQITVVLGPRKILSPNLALSYRYFHSSKRPALDLPAPEYEHLPPVPCARRCPWKAARQYYSTEFRRRRWFYTNAFKLKILIRMGIAAGAWSLTCNRQDTA